MRSTTFGEVKVGDRFRYWGADYVVHGAEPADHFGFVLIYCRKSVNGVTIDQKRILCRPAHCTVEVLDSSSERR